VNKLHEGILQDLQIAGIKDAEGIIRTMLTAFDVKEVNQDVVEAIKEDYFERGK
jgi:hypothetical protein